MPASALISSVLIGLMAIACSPPPLAPSSVPTSSPRLATPVPTARLPTPVPTPFPPSSSPSAQATAVPKTGELLLRLTTCSHTCGTPPGTTFLDDGRVLWESPDGSGQVLDGRLTEAALGAVRDAIEATPALGRDGSYVATLRPGAEPNAHGVGSFRFEVQSSTGPVEVLSWDPASLVDQPELWIVPQEMTDLAELARRLADPVAWLGSGAFADDPVPYVPTGAVVRVDLYPEVGDIGGFSADVDDVEWPFGQPIETAGERILGEDQPAPRCILLDGADALALRAAEGRAGATRDPRLWESTVEYDWKRAGGFIQVTVRALLPFETGSCVDLLLGTS
ncbi:MAG TPA: hypothetical protein VFP56_06115 [Candidatus Limnocylindrales bacterium]|nr:hypothetical protein [Candidatus Limnocylindrales bacterium]